ncbi:hypothetical protein VNI00_012215 [Paramarasmius palmivorus]|uniref:Uncharacterized protein n=1 Tax=Paramarasmius palmivorus TaxID=297713 RepID=A0AAW0CA23_9AGAR
MTGFLESCEPWGLQIHGGERPYNVTLVEVDDTVVNITMGPNDNGFVYINRAGPSSLVMATVSDLTGQYAYGTPYIQTSGIAKGDGGDCIGQVSSSGSSIDFPVNKASRLSKADVAGIAIGGCVAILIVIVIWYSNRQRRRRHRAFPRLDPFSDTTGSRKTQKILRDRRERDSPADEQDSHVSPESTVEAGIGTVIIQHRDAGHGRIRELPPPYEDARDTDVEVSIMQSVEPEQATAPEHHLPVSSVHKDSQA